jgi:hypothetical protein
MNAFFFLIFFPRARVRYFFGVRVGTRAMKTGVFFFVEFGRKFGFIEKLNAIYNHVDWYMHKNLICTM